MFCALKQRISSIGSKAVDADCWQVLGLDALVGPDPVGVDDARMTGSFFFPLIRGMNNWRHGQYCVCMCFEIWSPTQTPFQYENRFHSSQFRWVFSPSISVCYPKRLANRLAWAQHWSKLFQTHFRGLNVAVFVRYRWNSSQSSCCQPEANLNMLNMAVFSYISGYQEIPILRWCGCSRRTTGGI